MQNNISYILKNLNQKFKAMDEDFYFPLENKDFMYILSNYCKDILDKSILEEGKIPPFTINDYTFTYKKNDSLLKVDLCNTCDEIYILRKIDGNILFNRFRINYRSQENVGLLHQDVLLDKEYLDALDLSSKDLEFFTQNFDFIKQVYLPEKYDAYEIKKCSVKKDSDKYKKITGTMVKNVEYSQPYNMDRYDYKRKLEELSGNYDLKINVPVDQVAEKKYILIEKKENDFLVYRKEILDINHDNGFAYLLDETKQEIENKKNYSSLLNEVKIKSKNDDSLDALLHVLKDL